MLDATKAKESSLWANRKCLLICCIVSMANAQYGFDTAAIGGLQAMPGFLKVFGFPSATSPTGYGIDPTFQQLISSLLTLGSFISSLLAGFFSTYFGRKHAIWLACVLNAVACAIQIATTSKGAIYFGRLLLGIANGFLVTFSNVYTAEASPAHLRGVLVALFAYWVNIGSILGGTVNNFTKRRMDKSCYQIPLGCLYIIPTILAVGLFFVPESPRFLLHHGKEAEAKRALIKLRGSALTTEELEWEWAEMLRGTEEEKKNAKSVGWIDMFRGTDCNHISPQASSSFDGLFQVLFALTFRFSRHRLAPHASLLRDDRVPKRVGHLVPDRVPDVLPAAGRSDQGVRVLDHDVVHGLHRRQRRHVRDAPPGRPPLDPHDRRHGLRHLPAGARDHGQRRRHRGAAGGRTDRVHRAVQVLLQRLRRRRLVPGRHRGRQHEAARLDCRKRDGHWIPARVARQLLLPLLHQPC